MVDTARRAKLRAEVASQRVAALSLQNKIVDVPTKALLLPVLHTLADVDSVFLSSVSDDRTADQESWWLGHAERWLQVAVRELQVVSELIQKHGGPEKVRTI